MGSGPPARSQGKGLSVQPPGSVVGGRSVVLASPGALATGGILGNGISQPTCARGSWRAAARKKWGVLWWATRVARVLPSALFTCRTGNGRPYDGHEPRALPRRYQWAAPPPCPPHGHGAVPEPPSPPAAAAAPTRLQRPNGRAHTLRRGQHEYHERHQARHGAGDCERRAPPERPGPRR